MNKIIYLEDNMIDEEERVIFEADIAYQVERGGISNEDGIRVPVNEIWVNYRLVHQRNS